MEETIKENNPNGGRPTPFAQTFFHGAKAELTIGEFIETDGISNFGAQKQAKYIYLTATLDAAIWGAELASGDSRERIYLVEPTGAIEDDPNLTDKKFPGNPTKSYRSKHPFLGQFERDLSAVRDKSLKDEIFKAITLLE